MKNMTIESPMKVIFRFMIPVLLGNLLQLTYSIADVRIIGGFLGDDSLAAVGSTTVLFTLYMGFFMGIAAGFSITISQKFGAGKFEEVKTSFAASLLLGISLAIIMIVGTIVLLNPVLAFMNVPADLLPEASGYIRLVLLGMIVTMIYDVLLASARAIGDSLTPLLILILSVLLNIAGDLFFLGVFHTGVKGAAVATVIAQIIALIVCGIYILKKYSFFRIGLNSFKEIKAPMIKDMLASGISMGLMSSLISIGSLILQTSINELGNSYIVAQTAARRLTEALMSVLIAVGQTMATFCGQNYGAQKFDRIKKGLKSAYFITGIWCIIVIIIVFLLSPVLVMLITGSSDIIMINAASKYLKVDCTLYILVAVIMIQRNSLQGIGERITPLISSGIEMVGKIILTYTLVPVFAYNGVILVEPIVWVVMIIPLMMKMKKVERLEKWQK